jgi:hypothetical protein
MEFTFSIASKQQLKKLKHNYPCYGRQMIQQYASQKVDSFYVQWPLHEFRQQMQRLIKTRDIKTYEEVCALIEAVYTLYEIALIRQSSTTEHKEPVNPKRNRRQSCKVPKRK